MPGLKERAKTLIELVDGAYFIFADRPLELEPKAAALLTPEDARTDRQAAHRAGSRHATWTAETTEAAMRNFAEQNNLKLGAVAQPLRVALTGRTTSPGIFDVLAVLGRRGVPGPARRSGAGIPSDGTAPRVGNRPSCSAHGNELPICATLSSTSRAASAICLQTRRPGMAGFRNDFIGDITMDAKSSTKTANTHRRQQELTISRS